MSVPHRVCKACGHYDGKEIVYRHEAQRGYNLEWPSGGTSSFTTARRK
jgi:hypothetical protein